MYARALLHLFSVVLFILPALASGPEPFSSQCTSLASILTLPNSTINFAQYIPKGTNLTFGGLDPTCASNDVSQVMKVDFCRLSFITQTSNRSQVQIEAWLPRNWTGRLMTTGNGGIDGCIQYEDVAYATNLGFATMGANNGHNGTGGQAFYGNEDVVIDFAYRSLHTAVVLGKSILKTFYASALSHSYYFGCSLGGRQALKSALNYPADFDGIVAGSPGADFNNLYSWRGRFVVLTGPPNAAQFVPVDVWNTTIHSEVLRQCDLLDGVKDGIIEDPDLCDFRPEALICANGNTSSSCLTSAQVNMVRQIYTPFYGLNGNLIYPPMQPGNEDQAPQTLYTGQPYPPSQDWFRYAILEDPSWDPRTLNLTDVAYANAKNPGNISTWSGDLSAFYARGGKLIHYHGRADGQITSDNSERYYNLVSTTMSLPYSDLDDFYRFFRISGMHHCSGGPGAWDFGQVEPGAGKTPSDNVLLALVNWVENGTAPETMEGTKYIDDEPTKGVSFKRRHCRYPLRNIYGGGNASDPNSWSCQYPTP